MDKVNGVSAAFKTTDGKMFKTIDAANKHQLQINNVTIITEEVRELLNTAVIKLGGIKEDSNYTLIQLKKLLSELAENESLNFDSTSFYDSTCY